MIHPFAIKMVAMTQPHTPLRQILKTLKIDLPQVTPGGTYLPAKRVGNMIYVSGQVPMIGDKIVASGPVPSSCSIEQAQKAARLCVINALASVQTLGADALDKLRGVLRVGCFVNSDSNFTAQPSVGNGASDFLIELFGDAGRHARVAIGVNTLPLGVSVEIEFIFLTD